MRSSGSEAPAPMISRANVQPSFDRRLTVSRESERQHEEGGGQLALSVFVVLVWEVLEDPAGWLELES